MSTSKRPGGRTAEIRTRINDAVVAILIDKGTDACTFSAVADQAGVERSTLYRRYEDRWDMIVDAFLARAEIEVMPDAAASFPDQLESVLRKLSAQLESRLGAAIVSAAASLRANSGADYSRPFFDRRMAQLDAMFEAAIQRGELPPSIDREELFTFAAGPIYFRTFIAARGADEQFIRTIVSSVCWLFCSPSVAAKLSVPARLA